MAEKKINNKVEKLIGVFRTQDQLKELIDEDSISALGEYSDKDKELLEEFNKIYHLGLNQLEKFIDKLEEIGEDIDETSIIYYKQRLLNGPLRSFVIEKTKDKKFWKLYTDTNGVFGNATQSSNTEPVWLNSKTNIPVDTWNKLPGFVQSAVQDQVIAAQDVFFNSFNSVIVNDNTLPFIDKNPSERVSKEIDGGRNKDSHANNMVMDVEYRKDLESISTDIFNKVKEFLEEDFKLYEYIKTVLPFDSDSNISTTANYVIGRKIMVGTDNLKKVDTELTGRQFDSFERMKYELELEQEDKNTKFKLRTIKGQLGSGEEVKSDPIN
jgi:hypothetical protein